MEEKGGFGRPYSAEDDEIEDVEVEEVGDAPLCRVGFSATLPCPRRFPDSLLDDGESPEDIALVEVEPASPVPDPVAAPAKPSRRRLRPPVNRTEALLRVLVAIALAVLLGLGVYLFFLTAPERYASFRSLFPESWNFPPRVLAPTSPGMNLPDQG